MASIYKRGSTYTYRVYVGKDPATKKDKYVSKGGFRSQKDAQLAAAVIERQVYNGEYIEPSNIRLADLTQDWLKHYNTKVKESTVIIREQSIRKFITAFDNCFVQQVTHHDYQQFIDNLAMKYTVNHVKIIHTSVRMLFQYAKEKRNLIKTSPCNGVDLPKERQTVADVEHENTTDDFFEQQELQSFLSATKQHGLYIDFALFTTLAYSGLRVGECRALKWSDINFHENTLRVTKTAHTVYNQRKKFRLETPKTTSSRRTILLDQFVIDTLKQHKEEQAALKAHNHLLYHDYDFIFANNEGSPMSVTLINNRMRQMLARTNINKNLTSHSFRFTHAALLIESGVHIKEIQTRLGHSSISTTMDIYARLTKKMESAGAEKFSDYMKQVSDTLNRL